MNNAPLVSVCMITYNHNKYIEQAIESVLMQKTNFGFELVIGEDFSKDRTREICISYKRRYPEKINLILNEKNLGMIPNFINTMHQCKGEYIALLEGDDYWTDPYKLQKQVDFLEANPQYSMCFHNAQIIYENKSKENRLFFSDVLDKQVFKTKDLILEGGWLMPSASMLFKRSSLPQFPSWYSNIFNGDVLLQLLLSTNGDVVYLDEVMSVYRKFGINSISSVKRNVTFYLDNLIYLFLKFNKHTRYKYTLYIWYIVFFFYLKRVKALILSKIKQILDTK